MRNLLIAIICLFAAVIAEDLRDFNTKVMNSTFKIQGENSGYIGTCFLIGIPVSDKPDFYFYTLVSAKHVFDNINGDYAILYLREKSGDIYKKLIHQIPIRSNGKNLYVSHPNEDVAIINIPIPDNLDFDIIYPDDFATDELINKSDINPGDEVFTYGYSLGFEYNEAGFPLLRSGRISSYPIIPSTTYKRFYVDINIFSGNSGGPVVFSRSSSIKNKVIDLASCDFILGLIAEETIHQEHVVSMHEERLIKTKLLVATVVNSRFILETIDIFNSMHKNSGEKQKTK